MHDHQQLASLPASDHHRPPDFSYGDYAKKTSSGVFLRAGSLHGLVDLIPQDGVAPSGRLNL